MPARHEQFRRLNDDFRRFLGERAAWPWVKEFLAVLKPAGGGNRASIASLKTGGVVPVKYTDTLVKLLWDRPELGEYLASKGVNDAASQLTAAQVADRIAGPIQSQPGPAADDPDWFMIGIEKISDLMIDYVWGKLVRPGMFCSSEEEVRAASRMCLVTFGRELRKRSLPLAENEAIKAAEQHMRTTFEIYSGQAIEFWKANRWTFLFATVNRQRVACSMVVPLKEATYEAVRTGQITAHSCSASDLEPTSRFVVIEHLGLASDDVCPSRSEKTGQALRTIFLQIAKHSLTPERAAGDERRPLRVLTFAGNPQHASRAKRYGFQPTGAKIPGYDVDILELTEKRGWLLPLVVGMLQDRLIKLGLGG